MQIVLRTQSGKANYLTVNADKSLQDHVAAHLSISKSIFQQKHYLVFSGNVVKTDSFPEDLVEGCM